MDDLAADWRELADWMGKTRKQSADRDAYPLAPDSLLAGDEQGMPPGVSVAAVTRALLDSAVDSLSGAVLAITAGQVHPVATATTTRGAVELAGVGMWILAGTGRQGRQQRAMRVAHDSSFNAVKFFQGLADSPGSPKNVQEECTQAVNHHRTNCVEISDAAVRLGIKKTAVTAKLDRTAHLREVDKARGTDFFRRWQLCSGYAHGLAWASSFFNRHLYTHEMEGGGNLQGGYLAGDSALAMLGWGRHAIEELQGTFAAVRTAMPDSSDDTTLFSGQPEKVKALFPGVRIETITIRD
jgi:hypothetical protein